MKGSIEITSSFSLPLSFLSLFFFFFLHVGRESSKQRNSIDKEVTPRLIGCRKVGISRYRGARCVIGSDVRPFFPFQVPHPRVACSISSQEESFYGSQFRNAYFPLSLFFFIFPACCNHEGFRWIVWLHLYGRNSVLYFH